MKYYYGTGRIHGKKEKVGSRQVGVTKEHAVKLEGRQVGKLKGRSVLN